MNLILVYVIYSFHFLLANSFEYGVIAYFEQKCPQGWEEFSRSAGRVIISSGLTYDTRGELRNFQPGQVGGEYSHVMTVQELASHHHTNGSEGLHPIYGGGVSQGTRTYPSGIFDSRIDANTSTVGNGWPFNIVQPYIALVACKYVKQKNEQIEQLQNQQQNDSQQLKVILEQQKNDSQQIQQIKEQQQNIKQKNQQIEQILNQQQQNDSQQFKVILEQQKNDSQQIQQIEGKQQNTKQEIVELQYKLQNEIQELEQKQQQENLELYQKIQQGFIQQQQKNNEDLQQIIKQLLNQRQNDIEKNFNESLKSHDVIIISQQDQKQEKCNDFKIIIIIVIIINAILTFLICQYFQRQIKKLQQDLPKNQKNNEDDHIHKQQSEQASNETKA